MRAFAALRVAAGLLALLLAACSQEELLQKFSSPEDQARARHYVELLQARDFEALEQALDTSVARDGLRGKLQKMAEYVPPGEPISVHLVGARRNFFNGVSSVNTTLEYEFRDTWMLASVTTKDKDGAPSLVAFHVEREAQSLAERNRFTLSGKGAAQLGVLAAMIGAVLVTLLALVRCATAKQVRGKWRWLLFILFGIGQLSVDWTSGEWSFHPVVVQLFSMSFAAPVNGPWMLSVSLPLGALLFLSRKRVADDASPPMPPATA